MVVSAGVLFASLFGVIAWGVVTHEGAVSSDPRVMRWAVDHRTGWLTMVMKVASVVGSNVVLVPLVLATVVGLVWVRRRWRSAMLVVLSLAGAEALYQIVKPWVGRARPPVTDHLVRATNFAFPSGHATQAAAFGALAVVLAVGRARWIQAIIGVAAGVLVLLVGLSRVYLGVHWWTDVVGGWALGGAWLCLVLAVMLRTLSRPRHVKSLT
jgi:membrane-associated phospholipid phosphatase